MINIIQRRKIWFSFSSILIFVSLTAFVLLGVKPGIDFTGGTLMEFTFRKQSLSSQEIKEALRELDLGDINIQFSGNNDVLLRFRNVDEDTHQKIIENINSAISEKTNDNIKNSSDDSPENNNKAAAEETGRNKVSEEQNSKNNNNIDTETKNSNKNEKIENVTDNEKKAKPGRDKVDIENNNTGSRAKEENSVESAGGSTENENNSETNNKTESDTADISTKNKEGNIKEKRFDSIGPIIGKELKRSAFLAITIVLVAIILYIGWAFRKVSRPVSSFKYGIIATIALFHDVIIILGVFSFLGHFYSVEVGISFVAALLVVLGYSVNDTIVVFDRTRENLLRSGIDNFEKVVNKSVNETLIRSLNTSFTTLLVLCSLYLFGGETIKYFIVALMIGIFAGTYSSIFIASPLLVSWQKWDYHRRSRK